MTRWGDDATRLARLSERRDKIRAFRRNFAEFEEILPDLANTLPGLLTKLYSDCQEFAEAEILSLLEGFEQRLAGTRKERSER